MAESGFWLGWLQGLGWPKSTVGRQVNWAVSWSSWLRAPRYFGAEVGLLGGGARPKGLGAGVYMMMGGVGPAKTSCGAVMALRLVSVYWRMVLSPRIYWGLWLPTGGQGWILGLVLAASGLVCIAVSWHLWLQGPGFPELVLVHWWGNKSPSGPGDGASPPGNEDGPGAC